jgi:hypothetical protein
MQNAERSHVCNLPPLSASSPSKQTVKSTFGGWVSSYFKFFTKKTVSSAVTITTASQKFARTSVGMTYIPSLMKLVQTDEETWPVAAHTWSDKAVYPFQKQFKNNTSKQWFLYTWSEGLNHLKSIKELWAPSCVSSARRMAGDIELSTWGLQRPNGGWGGRGM